MDIFARLVDPFGKVGTCACEADPFPGGHAAIATVERIGKLALATFSNDCPKKAALCPSLAQLSAFLPADFMSSVSRWAE
jgi:hypothetical protein